MNEQPVRVAQAIRCDQCHHEVPALDFCVRCGDPLLAEKHRAGLSGRRSDRFAAAPGERALALHLSTLFPQLPRADMATFQLAFLIGLAVIVGLAALGLFPVALAAALVLVPLLLILYIWEVDIYEDEPLRVLAFTGAWGFIAGALMSLAIRAFAPAESGLLQGPTTGTVLLRGVLIPLIGGGLMLIGPLILLPYRKFNDVLDGATFGSTSAVAFVAGLGIVQSLDLFAGGLQPGGDPMPWIVRLLSLGVATPLIAAGAIGAAAGAAWLQWRAPVTDRHRLGWLGRPVVAAIVAGALLVAAAVGQLLLPFLPALVWLGFLAALSLIWLRAVIHLGLLQEAAEIEVGPDRLPQLQPAHACPQLLRQLRLLAPRRPEVAQRSPGRGPAADPDAPGALVTLPGSPPTAPWRAPLAVQPRRASPMRLLLFFVLALGFVVLVVGAIGLAVSPPAPTANCPDPRVPCAPEPRPTLDPNAPSGGGTGAPRPTAIRPGTVGGTIGALPSPRARSDAAKLRHGTSWASSALGFTLEYDDGIWSLQDEGSNGLYLIAANGNVAVTVVGYPAGEVSPRDAFQREVSRLGDTIIGLTEEPDEARQVPGTPVIGFEPGVGTVFTGTLNSPQGPGSNVSVAVLAATDSQITIVVNVITIDSLREPAFGAADSILNTVRWPGRAQ